MGAPRARRARRARPGPRHADGDALRAAQVVPEFPPRRRGASGRDQPGAARSAAARRSRGATCRSPGIDGVDEVPDGPAIVDRQRVLRRAAGRQFVSDRDGWRERMVGARPGRRARLRGSRPIRMLGPLSPARARAPVGAILEWRYGPAGRARWRGASRGTAARRCHRLRPRRDRLRRHPAGGAPARVRRPAGRARRGRPHRPCRFRDARRGSAEPKAPRAHGPVRKARSCARSASSRAPRRSSAGATPEQAADIDARARALDRAGPDGMGELFKVLAIADPRLRPLPGFDRSPTVAVMTIGMFIEAPELQLAFPASATPSSPARAACRTGIYASLNGGLGSRDAPGTGAREPRAAWRRALGVAPDALVTCYQVHRPTSIVVEEPVAARRRARAPTRMVTRVPGLALGVATADCGPVLFADRERRRGRRRACRLARRARRRARGDRRRDGAARRAARARIRAVLGPTIRQAELRGRPGIRRRASAAEMPSNAALLRAGGARRPFHVRPARLHRGAARRAAGVQRIADLGLCTYADPERFFSYRRTTHRGEPDYGRHINAIALAK